MQQYVPCFLVLTSAMGQLRKQQKHWISSSLATVTCVTLQVATTPTLRAAKLTSSTPPLPTSLACQLAGLSSRMLQHGQSTMAQLCNSCPMQGAFCMPPTYPPLGIPCPTRGPLSRQREEEDCCRLAFPTTHQLWASGLQCTLTMLLKQTQIWQIRCCTPPPTPSIHPPWGSLCSLTHLALPFLGTPMQHKSPLG